MILYYTILVVTKCHEHPIGEQALQGVIAPSNWAVWHHTLQASASKCPNNPKFRVGGKRMYIYRERDRYLYYQYDFEGQYYDIL